MKNEIPNQDMSDLPTLPVGLKSHGSESAKFAAQFISSLRNDLGNLLLVSFETIFITIVVFHPTITKII
jgi:hypothetical protein